MFRRADGPTALRGDLVRALCLSTRAADVEVGGEIGPAVGGMAAVWNGRKGFVAVLVRRVDPPFVERWVWDGKLRSAEALDEALEEAHGFVQSLGLEMDGDEYAALPEADRQRRLHSWNKLRKVRKPKPPAVGARSAAPLAPTATPLDIAPEDIEAPVEIPEMPPVVREEAGDLIDLPAAAAAPDLEPGIEVADVEPIPEGYQSKLMLPEPGDELEPEDDDLTPVPFHRADAPLEAAAPEAAIVSAEPIPGDIDPNSTTGCEDFETGVSATDVDAAGKAVLGRIELVRRHDGDERKLGPLERLLALF